MRFSSATGSPETEPQQYQEVDDDTKDQKLRLPLTHKGKLPNVASYT